VSPDFGSPLGGSLDVWCWRGLSMQGEDEEDYALRGEGGLSAIHARVDAWERSAFCVGEWAACLEETTR